MAARCGGRNRVRCLITYQAICALPRFLFYLGSGKALNVELTSYVLLGLIKLRTPQDMLEASSIIRWLSRQRNSQGGFISTQDTVVALQVTDL